MNCQGCRTWTWTAEQLAWNNVDSNWPVRVDWAGGLFVKAQNLRLCQMSKCHFTIIMSCVQSTLRNFGTYGEIRLSDNFGLRLNFGLGRAKFNRRPKLSESRISPYVPKFRSVDWTHDMIIVKWHLLIWHKRKFCALTNRPPAQSTRTGQWLSTLFHANCSAVQVHVLHPWQFIFVPSSRRRSVLQVFLSSKR